MLVSGFACARVSARVCVRVKTSENSSFRISGITQSNFWLGMYTWSILKPASSLPRRLHCINQRPELPGSFMVHPQHFLWRSCDHHILRVLHVSRVTSRERKSLLRKYMVQNQYEEVHSVIQNQGNPFIATYCWCKNKFHYFVLNFIFFKFLFNVVPSANGL